MKTTQQQLDEIQAAITKVLSGGQSYTIDGRTYTRGDINVLRVMENDLKRQLARENGRVPFVQTVKFNAMGY